MPKTCLSARWSTGTYVSSKTKREMTFKSSWERQYATLLDASEIVVDWTSEPFYVIYFLKNNVHKYIPDFVVETTSGEKYIVEVKPVSMRKNVINEAKRASAIQYCAEHDMKYYEWSPDQPVLPL